MTNVCTGDACIHQNSPVHCHRLIAVKGGLCVCVCVCVHVCVVHFLFVCVCVWVLWEPGLTRVNSGYTNWKRAETGVAVNTTEGEGRGQKGNSKSFTGLAV